MIFNQLNAFFGRWLIAASALVSAAGLCAQSGLDTEQPFVSNSAGLIPTEAVQIEAGGWLEWFTPQGAESEEFRYAVPLGIIRYGWRDRLEIRVGARFNQSLGQAEEARGGFKWNVVPDAERFRVAWVSELETQLNSVSTSTRVPSQHRMCADWNDGKRWSARANWGVRWGGDSTEMVVAAAAAREVGWQGWTAYIEPVWRSVGGWRLHAGALLAVGDDGQVDVGFQRDLDRGDFRFTFGYTRRLWREPDSTDSP